MEAPEGHEFRITCLRSSATALRMDLFANIKGIKGLSGQTGHPLHFIMLPFIHAIVRYLFYRLAQLLIFSYAFQTLLSYFVKP